MVPFNVTLFTPGPVPPEAAESQATARELRVKLVKELDCAPPAKEPATPAPWETLGRGSSRSPPPVLDTVWPTDVRVLGVKEARPPYVVVPTAPSTRPFQFTVK